MARPKIRPDIDENELIINPFVFTNDFVVKTRAFHASTDLVDKNSIIDGIITEAPITIKSKLIVEDEDFTKIYLTKDLRLHMMRCTPKAKDLCWFIVYELKSQQDWLWINKERYLKESNVSLNTYKAAILELIRYGVISTTIYKDTYWINPMLFFKGNRIKKYPSKLKERD